MISFCATSRARASVIRRHRHKGSPVPDRQVLLRHTVQGSKTNYFEGAKDTPKCVGARMDHIGKTGNDRENDFVDVPDRPLRSKNVRTKGGTAY